MTRRPALVWVIFILFCVAPLVSMGSYYVALFGGLLPPHASYKDRGIARPFLSVSLSTTQIIGSFLLWRLRRLAFHFFVGASVLSGLGLCWSLLVRDYVVYEFEERPPWNTLLLVSMILRLLILVTISGYISRLTRIGLLK